MADTSATPPSGAAPATSDLASRLDRLEQRLDGLDDLRTTVETALAAQARRIETILGRLGRGPDPIDDGRASGELVASLQASVAAVAAGEDDRLDRVEAAIHAILSPVESVTAAVEALDQRVTALLEATERDRRAVEQVAERLATIPAAIDDGLGAVGAAVDEHRTRTERDREAFRTGLQEDAAAWREALTTATTLATSEAAARFGKAQERLAAAGDAMDAVADAVARQLEARDRAVADDRRELARAFAEQVVDGLGRRDRRRLARRLEPVDPPPAREVGDLPTTPVVARPASTPVPASRPAPATPPTPVTTPTPVTPPATTPDEVAADVVDGGPHEPPVAEEPRVQPSRRTRPVRRAASDPRDPAAIRRILAGVRGLGPARQSALIDRFGSLDAIRAATDDELLEVPGIGPALLPGIRDAVG